MYYELSDETISEVEDVSTEKPRSKNGKFFIKLIFLSNTFPNSLTIFVRYSRSRLM